MRALLARIRRHGEAVACQRCWPRSSRNADLPTRVLAGPDALETIASHEEVDAVMAAIVGAAGLAPCLAAARAGKRLLLANKEALVVGGELFMRTRARGRRDAAADRQRAFGHLPVAARRPGHLGAAHRQDHPDGVRRAVPHARTRHARRGHARTGLRPSELGHGPQDLGRFGHHDEQGARSDRGAASVRRRRPSRSRW